MHEGDQAHFGVDPDLCTFVFPAGVSVLQPAPPSVDEALDWFREWQFG